MPGFSSRWMSPLAMAAALLMGSSTVQAQSLVELYEAARTNDAAFIGAKSQFEANLAKANQTLGGILPNIALTATATRTHFEQTYDKPQILPNTIAAATQRNYGTKSGAVTLTQPLYRPAAWAAYRQGGPLLQQAAALFEAAEQDLLVRVSQAYFDVLNSEDTLSFVKAQKQAVGEQLAAAKRNFEVGAATITGVRDAQARFDLTSAQEIAAENDVRVKRLALDLVVGQQNTQPKRLAAGQTKLVDAPKEDLQAWVATSESTSPAVRQAQLALEVARLEVDKAVAGHKPTLDAQVVSARTRNIDGSAVSPYDSHVFSPYAQVTLSIPIFSGLTTMYKVRETKALEDKAQADFDAAKRNTAQAARTAYLSLLAGLSQVKAYEAAEASSQSSLDANKLGYSVGVNINIDVLNAQSQLFQTKRDLAKARYDVLVGSLKLRQAAGTLTPQDLLPINALLAP
jgi:outer membrane protein